MRIALYGAAPLALALLFSPDLLRGALASSASALFEATPFLLGAAIVARLLRLPGAAAFLGCGCGSGPSARSLPAAVATCMIFGPIVAAARFLAAMLAARALSRRFHAACPHEPADLAGELAELLPAALVAGAAMQLGGALNPARLPPVLCLLAGGLLGFAAAPCALGAVAIAGALHARSPLAAAAFLCVAGIVDLRALSSRPHVAPRRDALAYALLAVALGAVALRGGDALIHPALAPVLGFSAAMALIGAARYRREISPAQRAAPVLMLAGVFTAAPPPPYYATETTLGGLFPGERLTFTGTLVRDGSQSAVVRYAITCCRADASPVVVRLDRAPPYEAGTWLRVDGRIDGDLRLEAARTQRVAPPVDPFIYR
ncbi:MAG TPA: hypothetical protein VIX83_05110 [Candidatus Cybelea sp.]